MLANGVKETTTTTGTGTVTLSAVTGFPRFSQVLSIGQFVDYAIQDGNNWEWGVGKIGASNTLERVAVTAKFDGGTYSKNPTTKLSLSGSATVFAASHEGSFGIGLGGNSVNATKNLVPSANLVNAISLTQFGYTFPAANRLVAFPWVWPDGIDRYATGVKLNVITASGTKCRIAFVTLGDASGSAKVFAQTGDI
ncbi:MAG: hypothetical protein JSR28_14285, partial [Proteobacteria bacterium]|nr:hypothetical protein [Pseudomonadota bacterium]